MGNSNALIKLQNQSNRNMRVFLTKDKLEVDAFIAKIDGEAQGMTSVHQTNATRRFYFRADITGHRVLASQTQLFPWDEKQRVSIFIEDEDDERICSKHVCLCMPLPCPTTIILYDV